MQEIWSRCVTLMAGITVFLHFYYNLSELVSFLSSWALQTAALRLFSQPGLRCCCWGAWAEVWGSAFCCLLLFTTPPAREDRRHGGKTTNWTMMEETVMRRSLNKLKVRMKGDMIDQLDRFNIKIIPVNYLFIVSLNPQHSAASCGLRFLLVIVLCKIKDR